jgi:hypothetical protein
MVSSLEQKEEHMPTGFFSNVTAIRFDKAIEARDRLIAAITIQKQAVQARIDGKEFNPNPESERALSTWFVERDGGWWTHVRVGLTPISLGGGDLFRVGPELTDLLTWYDQAIVAVRSGDLDEELQAATARRSERMKRRVA